KDFPFIQDLASAETEWREFLLHKQPLLKFSDVHLFLTNIEANKIQPVNKFNVYITRATDGTVVLGEDFCAMYAKFARFLVFGMITPYDDSKWINTKIEAG